MDFTPHKSIESRAELIHCRTKLDSQYVDDDDFSSMRVYARVRPLLDSEIDANYQPCIAVIDENIVRAVQPASSARNRSRQQDQDVYEDFEFTLAIGPETGQFMFFKDIMLEPMQEFIAGCNTLIFSYGITNSGKTFTLQGNEEHPGLIPLSIKLFFAAAESQLIEDIACRTDKHGDFLILNSEQQRKEKVLKDQLLSDCDKDVTKRSDQSNSKCFSAQLCDMFWDGYDFQVTETLPMDKMIPYQCALLMKQKAQEVAQQQDGRVQVWVSFIEIYNEHIYDLLQCNFQQRTKLGLAEDSTGEVYVKGVKEICVSTADEALKLLSLGRRNLRIASTKLNYQSSRSHCIYCLKVIRVQEDSTFKVTRLSFCDLAGSERQAKAGTSGQHLREAGCINTSLLVLGKCLDQMRLNQNSKEKRVYPFRESKLTRLFSGFFLGRGKAIMITNASPCEYTYDETLSVLRFSALATQLKINETYSSTIQSVNCRWMESKNRASFSGDLSILNETFSEDLKERDEMIETLLTIADDLRAKYEGESQKNRQMEWDLRKEICQEFSDQYRGEIKRREQQSEEYREGLLANQKDLYEKRLQQKTDRIKELEEELEEYLEENESSFDASSSVIFNGSAMTPSKCNRIPSDVQIVVEHLITKTEVDQESWSLQQELDALRKRDCSNSFQSEIDELKKYVEHLEKVNYQLLSKLESAKTDLYAMSVKIDNCRCTSLEARLVAADQDQKSMKLNCEKLEAGLKSFESTLKDMCREKDNCQKIASNFEKELEAANELLNVLRTENKEAQLRAAVLDKQLKDANAQLKSFDVLKTSSSDLDSKLKSAEQLIHSLKSELLESKEYTKNLQDQNQELVSEIAKQKSELQDNKLRVSELITDANNCRCVELNAQLDSAKEMFEISKEQLEKQVSSLESKLAESTQSIENLQFENSELSSKNDSHLMKLKQQSEQANKNILVLKEELDIFKTGVSDHVPKLKSAEQLIQSLESELWESREHTRNLQEANQELISQNEKQKSQLEDNKHRLGQLTADVSRCTELNAQLDSAKEMMETSKDQLEKQVASLESQLALATQNNENLRFANSKLSSKTEKDQIDLDAMKSKLESLTSKLDECECEALRVELSSSKATMGYLKDHCQELKKNLQDAHKSSDRLEQELQVSKNKSANRVTELEQQLKQVKEAISKLNENMDVYKTSVSDLEPKLKSANQVIQSLESELSQSKENTKNLQYENRKLISEIEKHKSELQDNKLQLAELHSVMDISKEQLEKQAASLQSQLTDSTQNIENLRSENLKLLSKSEKDQADLKSKLESLTSKLDECECVALRTELSSSKVAMENLEDRCQELKKNLRVARKSSDKLEKELQDSMKSVNRATELEQQLKQANETISKLNENLESSKDMNCNLNEEKVSMSRELSDLRSAVSSIEGLKLKIASSEAQVRELEETHKIKQTEMNSLQKEYKVLLKEKREFENTLTTNSESEIRKLRSQLSEAQTSAEEKKSNIMELEAEQERLLSENTKLALELDSTVQRLNALTAKTNKCICTQASSSKAFEEPETQNTRKSRRARPLQNKQILESDFDNENTSEDESVASKKKATKRITSEDESAASKKKTTKRKSDEDFVPRTLSKSRKKVSNQENRPPVQPRRKRPVQDATREASPLQKLASYAGSRIQKVVQSITEASPRVTRGMSNSRKKLYNADADWKY